MEEGRLSSPLLTKNAEELENANHDLSLDANLCSNPKNLATESWIESKKLWCIAGPAIFTYIGQYSLEAITQIFAGHLGTMELAAVGTANNVVAVLAFGIMLGMGSALETLCGQSFGAGQKQMLGVYMQRSWLILVVTALLLSFVYIFAPPILRLLGQSEGISNLAGKFCVWILPQLFAQAMNFPIQKFLQAQSKVMAMASISAAVVALHVLLSWLVITKLGFGLVGAALVLDLSWWVLVLGQLAYIVSGSCGEAWSGLSWLAFTDLWAFVKLSVASGVMLCLELWYMMLLVVLTGHLTNPEIAVDSISVCMNLDVWEMMIAVGFNAAISVRVSNELGAGRPRAAMFSVLVVTLTSLVIGIFFMVLIFLTKNDFPVLFTDSEEVTRAVTKLGNLLAFTMLLNSVQLVLSGVAIGAGWQTLVAYVNIGCYYFVGIPLGVLLGYKFNFGVMGIWSGMLAGISLQTLILLFITYRTNWKKEASEAESRIKLWGGSSKG